MAKTFTAQLTSKLGDRLKRDQEFCNKLGNAIYTRAKISNLPLASNWSSDATYGIPYISNGDIKLDLASGRTYTQYGEIESVDSNFPWDQQSDFKRLFGNEKIKFSYLSIGKGHIAFTHPTLGSFRLMRKTTDNKYVIQREFPQFKNRRSQNIWFEYQQKESLEKFPAMLNADHSYWIPTEKIAGGEDLDEDLDNPLAAYFGVITT